MSPLQRQTLLWSAIAAALAMVLLALGPVLTPFVTAAILAYVLEPAVRGLHTRGVPRALAALAAMLAALVVTLAIVLILVPIIQQEVAQIRLRLPGLVATIGERVVPMLSERLGIDVPIDLAGLRTWISQHVAGSGEDLAAFVLRYAKSGWGAALQVVGFVFLVPVVLFYLLLDWESLLARLREFVPPRWHGRTFDLLREVDSLLGQYLRGQMRVMGVLAVFYSLGLLAAGFKLWLPIGVLSGLLIAIPYLGFALGVAFALVDGMLQLGPLHGLVAVAIVYGIGQVLESVFLTPRLVGERIGLHPLAVILALLAFGSVFGFVGVLLALPLAAILAVALRRLRQAYLSSAFYGHA